MAVFAASFETREGPLALVMHRPEFFDGHLYIFRNGALEKVDVPTDADPGIVGDQLVVYVRTPWELGDRTYGTGTVIAMQLDAFLAGERDFTVVLEPGPRQTVQGTVPAGDFLLVSLLDNVQGQLWKYRRGDDGWIGEQVDAPGMGSVGIVDVDLHSNRFFFTYSSFVQPSGMRDSRNASACSRVASLTAR